MVTMLLFSKLSFCHFSETWRKSYMVSSGIDWAAFGTPGLGSIIGPLPPFLTTGVFCAASLADILEE